MLLSFFSGKPARNVVNFHSFAADPVLALEKHGVCRKSEEFQDSVASGKEPRSFTKEQ
jgi:hypothetical protein